jgi:hypothetical protein
MGPLAPPGLDRPATADRFRCLAVFSAENFLQRIAHRPMSYPILGDFDVLPRPVDWEHRGRTPHSITSCLHLALAST